MRDAEGLAAGPETGRLGRCDPRGVRRTEGQHPDRGEDRGGHRDSTEEGRQDLRGHLAVVHGVARSGRVVSAAALIMAAVFAGFIFNEDPVIKSIGFTLAISVLIDAFVVRMTLVPAAMALLGRRAWSLPRLLDRALPDVDIEGANHPDRTAGKDAERGEVPVG
ncbi:MMPL family transporter [Streptomyces sp. NPDC059340]|uniref:MMPL family transporter n=1 Tax=Streptomyces sp. NPDC059340 TaxID=3346806 RepID=UPI0036BC7249